MTLPARLIIALLLALPAVSNAAAQGAVDPDRGRLIAERWCASCHDVGPGTGGSVNVDVPPFALMADDPSYTPERFRMFLRDPHPPMPDMLLTEGEIDDLIAYFRSLKGD